MLNEHLKINLNFKKKHTDKYENAREKLHC